MSLRRRSLRKHIIHRGLYGCLWVHQAPCHQCTNLTTSPRFAERMCSQRGICPRARSWIRCVRHSAYDWIPASISHTLTLLCLPSPPLRLRIGFLPRVLPSSRVRQSVRKSHASSRPIEVRKKTSQDACIPPLFLQSLPVSVRTCPDSVCKRRTGISLYGELW